MSPRRRATVVAALLLVALSGGVAACAAPDAAPVQRSMESPPRPAPEPELPTDLGDDLEDLLPPGVDLPDVSIPDSVPDPDRLRECVDLTAAYSEIVVLAFSGDDDGRLAELFDQLDAAAPDEVRDDLLVLRDIVARAAQGGLIDATGELLSEEFTTANSAVVDWLASYCGAEGA